jgi:two-component SAPR family response regulator
MEDNMEGGLYFHSFLVDKDSRTGLNLTPEKPLSLSGGFTLAFDFKIRSEHDIYGYIFRLVGDQMMNIDLISNIENNSLVLVGGNSTLLNFGVTEVRKSTKGKWISAELTVDTDSSKLKFTLNGHQKTADYDVRRQKKFNLYFGRNNDLNFATTDVAPFILKDVRLFDKKKRLIRHWKLNRHSDGCVFDECKSAKAVATNAVWEINRRAEWLKQATITVAGKYPQITFDSERKRIFIVKNDIIYMYDAEKDVTDTFKSGKGVHYNVEINQLLYDKTTGELISYDFGKDSPARFDFAAQAWSNEDSKPIVRYFMHHNKYFDEKKRTIYTLGGYGFHQYSALLQSFSEMDTAHRWKSVDLSDVIHPRYLAAMGVWNDSLLLCFGGYGNASGKQYESPHNYYDLYAVNPSTLHVSKIWELNSVDKHFTNSNSLVVNNANQTFYTLSYPNNIFETQVFLHEYSLQTPEFRRLGNPVPFLFNDVESYCDLFIPSDSSALFAVTSYMAGNNSKVEIYSISYPPLSVEDTLQAEGNPMFPLRILLYAFVFAVALVLMYQAIIRIGKIIRIHSVLKTIESNSESDKKAKEETGKTLYPAIHLLGTFEALDSKGINISHLFSPTISQMFFLLYFRTTEDGKGITSNELQKILWPDRDYESARNNRNVYFNKLRPILNMMGNILLCKTNDHWILSYDREMIYNDYEQVMKNIALLKKETVLDRELLNRTLRIARRGKLLPYCEVEWADNYKTAYVNTIIEYLSELTEHPEVRNDWPLLLNIAEIILIQDSIEESGIRLKCNILFKVGKKKQAFQCYNKYVEEYFDILNIKPELTFNEIMK